MDVEQAEVVDGEACQSVADARVEHEDEPVLAPQKPGGRYPDDHRAGHQHGAGGKQDVEDEDKEVHRTVEVHRQRDGGVEEHPDAPPEDQQPPHL